MEEDNNDSFKSDERVIEKEIREILLELQKIMSDPKTNTDSDRKALLAAQLGTLYSEKEQLQDSLRFFLLALSEFIKLDDKHNIASVRGAIGSLYIRLNDYQNAKKYTEQAYEYWKGATYLNERIASLQNLGIIYLNLNEESKAVDFVIAAMRMSIQLQDEAQFALSIQILLEYYEKEEKYDILRELKLKALEFWEKMALISRQVKTLIDIGVLSQILNDYNEAEFYFKRAYNLAYQQSDLEKMLLAQGFLGENYFNQQEIEKSKQAYFDAFRLAVYLNTQKDHSKDIDQMRAALLVLGVDPEQIEKETKKALDEIKEEKK